MINGINDNNELINSRLSGQNGVGSLVTNPISNDHAYVKEAKYNFNDISAISKDAYYLYEREKDISSFTKLALAGMDDTSYNDRVEALFAQGVVNPFTDDNVSDLADDLSKNEDFLNTIEFNML